MVFAYRLAERLNWQGDPLRLLDSMSPEVVRNWWGMAILDGWMSFAEEDKPQTAEQMQTMLAGRFG